MKKLLAFICLCIQIVPIMGQSVLRTSHGVNKSCLCGTGVLLFFHYSCEEVSSWASAGKTIVICYDATRKGEV